MKIGGPARCLHLKTEEPFGGSATISHNTITNNEFIGVSNSTYNFAGGYGVLLHAAGSVTLDTNTISLNDDGIFADVVAGATLNGNIITNNNLDGMILFQFDNGTLSNNNVTGNTVDGIYFNGSALNGIRGNTSSNNGHDGLFFDSSSVGNTIAGNTAQGNLSGFDFEDQTGNGSGLGTGGRDNSYSGDTYGTANHTLA